MVRFVLFAIFVFCSAPACLPAGETGRQPAAAGPAQSNTAGAAALQDLRRLIDLSLVNQAANRPQRSVAAITAAFGLLDRGQSDPEQMVDLKFQMQHWRRQTKKTLLACVAEGLAPGAYLQALAELDALHIYIRPDEYHAIAACLPAAGGDAVSRARGRSALALLIANQGNPFFPAGIAPAAALTQVLTRKGPARSGTDGGGASGGGGAWAFARWTSDPEFSHYEYSDEGGVYFRGVHFLPGDVVLIDSVGLAAGTYTSMGMPQGHMSHASFFVILTRNGLRYPAIVDTGGSGITRAIPLSIYLRPTQAAYVEVYRLRDRPRGLAENLDREAQRFMRQEHHFDLSFGSAAGLRAPGSEDTYCPLTYSLIMERVGLAAMTPQTRIRPGLQANLAKFGLHFGDASVILSPAEYARDERFEFVEAIDNDQFRLNIIRALVAEQMMQRLEEGEVHVHKLPALFHIYREAIAAIQSNSLRGRLYRNAVGYTARDFPVGDARTLALAIYLRGHMSRAAESALCSLRKYEFRSEVSYSALRRDPVIQAALEKSMAPTRAWLKPRSGAGE